MKHRPKQKQVFKPLFRKPREVEVKPSAQLLSIDYTNIAGMVNNDGSIFCWFCLIDDVYLDEYDPNEVLPVMYSNQEFYDHLITYHKISESSHDGRNGYGKYKPFVQDCDLPVAHYERNGIDITEHKQGPERIYRENLGSDFMRCWATLPLLPVLRKFKGDEGDIMIHGYAVACIEQPPKSQRGKEGHIRCVLCEVDSHYFKHLPDDEKILLHSNNENGFEKWSYFNEDEFTKHLLEYHCPDRHMWEKYIPYIHYEPANYDYSKITELDIMNAHKPREEDWALFVRPGPQWNLLWQELTEEVNKTQKDYDEINKEFKKARSEYYDQKKPFRDAINKMVTELLHMGKVKTSKEAYRLILNKLGDEYPGLTGDILYKCFNEYNKSRWHK